MIHGYDFCFRHGIVDNRFELQQILSGKLLRSVDSVTDLRLRGSAFSAGFVGRVILPGRSLFCRNQRRARDQGRRRKKRAREQYKFSHPESSILFPVQQEGSKKRSDLARAAARRRRYTDVSIFHFDAHALGASLFRLDELIGEEIEQNSLEFSNAEAAHFLICHQRTDD